MNDTIDLLRRVVIDGKETAFDQVPTLLKKVLEHKLWRECLDEQGNQFKSFEAFVNHRLWEGLGSTIEDLLAFCRKREDVQALIRQEMGALADKGTNQHTIGCDNVTSTSMSRGNSETYLLRRLKRDRPDLAERVITRELSAHAAAVEAGFKRKLLQVPADDLDAALAKLERHYNVSLR